MHYAFTEHACGNCRLSCCGPYIYQFLTYAVQAAARCGSATTTFRRKLILRNAAIVVRKVLRFYCGQYGSFAVYLRFPVMILCGCRTAAWTAYVQSDINGGREGSAGSTPEMFMSKFAAEFTRPFIKKTFDG